MTKTERYFQLLWRKVKEADIQHPTHLEQGDKHLNRYIDDEGREHCIDCSGFPNIIRNYPDFKKWVLEKMEAKGMELMVGPQNLDGIKSVSWINYEMQVITRKEIKDNEILEAAIDGAIKYLEENNE